MIVDRYQYAVEQRVVVINFYFYKTTRPLVVRALEVESGRYGRTVESSRPCWEESGVVLHKRVFACGFCSDKLWCIGGGASTFLEEKCLDGGAVDLAVVIVVVLMGVVDASDVESVAPIIIV